MLPKNLNRLFTFGCSFTKYYWPVWPDILAVELNIPLYNLGRSGAGNQYILNMLMQADNIYNFDENDLIVISWTNVCREDRFRYNRSYKMYVWETPGNVFSQYTYDKRFVQHWADPVGYLLRDYANIKAAVNFLKNKKCKYSMLSMCNISKLLDQWNFRKFPLIADQLTELYQSTLLEINKSFYEVLWNDDINTKFALENKLHRLFQDGHPTPEECLTYLETVFDHKFKNSTVDQVKNVQSQFETTIIKFYDSRPGDRHFNTTFKIIYPSYDKIEHATIDDRIIHSEIWPKN